MTLVRMNDNFGICRLRAGSDVPSWAGRSADRDWRGFKIRGPLDPSSIGVLSSILLPLAEGGIGILAVSTASIP